MVNQGEIEGRLDADFYSINLSTIALKTKDLGELIEFSKETWNQKDLFEKTFPYIEISEINIETGSLSEIKEIEIKNAPSRAKMLVRNNDILVSTTRPNRGAIAHLNSLNRVSVASTGFSILREVIDASINKSFLFHILRSDFCLSQMLKHSSGGNYPAITQEALKKIQIPVPPMEVQAHIVELMQDAHATKQSKEAEATALRQSIDGYVLEQLGITLPTVEKRLCFGVSSSQVQGSRLDGEYNQQHNQHVSLQNQEYEPVPLKHYLDFFTSGSRPKGGVSQFSEGIPSIGGEHILDTGEIESTNLKYIPKEFHQKNTKSTLFKRDVLIIKDGATTGKVGILQEDYPYEEVNINEHVFLLRVKPAYNPYFLFSFLRTGFGQNQLKKEISGGTITGITKNVFDVVQIPLPPRPLQDAIAEEVQARLARAKQLESEAKLALASAKAEVERLLFGEANPSP